MRTLEEQKEQMECDVRMIYRAERFNAIKDTLTKQQQADYWKQPVSTP